MKSHSCRLLRTTETSKIQTIQGTRTSESCGLAPVCQMTQVRHVEVKSRTSSRDYDTGLGFHEDMSADRPKAQMSTSIVQEPKSKFEAKQKGSQVPTVQRVQKTVEVPRVQYIDKVADIPLDVQRQGRVHQSGSTVHRRSYGRPPCPHRVLLQPYRTLTICACTRLQTKMGWSMKTRRGRLSS